jgi:hypothetical protein
MTHRHTGERIHENAAPSRMAEEMRMMKTSWTGSVAAIGMAVVLMGAGVVVAKKPDDGGPGKGHGRGSEHGDSAGKQKEKDDGERGDRGRGGEKKGGGGKVDPAACEAASSVIQAFVDVTCPCDGVDDGNGGIVAWKNHGQYVRCVAHAVREAVRAAGVKRRCAKGIVPCAARSTCGKKRGVTCVVATTGTCMDGACSNDADLPCTTDADCATQACAITSAERCAEAGGTAGAGSCCAPGSPSGAFLD